MNSSILPRLVARASEANGTVQARQGAVEALAQLVELLKQKVSEENQSQRLALNCFKQL